MGPLPSIPPGFTRGLRTKSTEEDLELETAELEEDEDPELVVRNVHFTPSQDIARKGNVPQAGFEGIDDLLREEVCPHTKSW